MRPEKWRRNSASLAEDCISDLLEMEREELDPFREEKVIAAYQELAGQWDKDMKPMQQVLEVKPETDDQSLSDEVCKRRQTDCLSQEMGGECEPDARLEAAEKYAPPLEVFVWRQQGWESVELAACRNWWSRHR